MGFNNIPNTPSAVTTLTSLPVSGNSHGDVRLVADTNLMYSWSSATNTWSQVGSTLTSRGLSSSGGLSTRNTAGEDRFEDLVGAYAGFLARIHGNSSTSSHSTTHGGATRPGVIIFASASGQSGSGLQTEPIIVIDPTQSVVHNFRCGFKIINDADLNNNGNNGWRLSFGISNMDVGNGTGSHPDTGVFIDSDSMRWGDRKFRTVVRTSGTANEVDTGILAVVGKWYAAETIITCNGTTAEFRARVLNITDGTASAWQVITSPTTGSPINTPLRISCGGIRVYGSGVKDMVAIDYVQWNTAYTGTSGNAR